MSFLVHPSALDAYAAQLRRARDDTGLTEAYLFGYQVDGGWGEGVLIGLLGTSHVATMDAALSTIRSFTGVLNGSQYGLAQAAAYYQRTDADTAAPLDATLPGTRAAPPNVVERDWRDDPRAPAFRDNRDLASRLGAVGEVELTHPFAILDNLSLSNWALKAVELAIGVNPLEWVAARVAGDWEAFARAGKALARTADALGDVAYNVQGGGLALGPRWIGRAAEAADAHLDRLAVGTHDLVDPIRKIATQYDVIAQGVYNASEAVTGALKNIVDEALIAGIAIAAGTITAETGIGAVVGYSAGAFSLALIVAEWSTATKAITDFYGILQGCLGIIETQNLPPVCGRFPENRRDHPYRHPAVAR
ncbi:hypothetical protein [Cryptosporangium sp. NPDC048952]|uniref:hypothetical protein n=1 Tax=Cryptosporangium sp. NPDC048952 TaxID=3363961 RepID=UPI0037211BC7